MGVDRITHEERFDQSSIFDPTARTTCLIVLHMQAPHSNATARRQPMQHTNTYSMSISLAAAAAVALCAAALAPLLVRPALPLVDRAALQPMPAAPDACTLQVRKRIAWGVATSAYQIEGAWNEDCKSLSIWDTFVRQPGSIHNNETGDHAVDHYHRYKSDIAVMRGLGIKHYRLSISWPRILPQGGKGTPINKAGVAFYVRLLKALLHAGITPVVTLYHWDLPQTLQDKYGGFLHMQLAEDFAYYADVVFEHLGPYVRHWLTFNEPTVICQFGYLWGQHAPGMKGGLEAYQKCARTLLVAHGKAVQLYRSKHRKTQGGRISIAVVVTWGVPFNATSPEDATAAEEFSSEFVSWFADPIFKGHAPSDLPELTPEELAIVNRSADFFALNLYTARFVRASAQGYVVSEQGEYGQLIGRQSDAVWLFEAPFALRATLRWVSRRYDGVEIWVTENGVAVSQESNKPLAEALLDTNRLQFFKGYLANLCLAVLQDGVNVGAYYAWSLLDNFEWADGYKTRFGITFVDYDNDLKRHPKLSAYWLSQHFFRHGATALPPIHAL